MGDKTNLIWTESTWNPVTGCSKVSQGCKNCYAERDWVRLEKNVNSVYHGRHFTEVMCHPERLEQPSRWSKPRKIFVNSMSDLFHDDVPFDFIEEVYKVMAKNPHHIFQVLTKRPERMAAIYSMWRDYGDDCRNFSSLPNVWVGVSVEDQATAEQRIPLLIETTAAVKWISAEPLLDTIYLTWIPEAEELDWAVVGGESGPNARKMPIEAVELIHDYCKAFEIPFLFKQWGEWLPTGRMLGDHGPLTYAKVGKKVAGRLLDGVEHNGYPR